MAIAGRILILPKGEYNASTTYSMLDLVSYNGASWLAKKTAVGITPSDSNSEYWQKLIEVAGKQDTIKGGATTITDNNLTVNRALVSDGNGKVAVSAVTATELGYLDGVTGNIQTQLNGKSDEEHTHDAPSLNDCDGTLELTKGGTGAKTAKEAEFNVLAGMTMATTQMTDSTQIACVYSSPSKTQGKLYWRNATALWDYIKTKMGNIDSASVRYVSDENDANYGWMQYKVADGTWVNWSRLYFGDNYIIQDGVYNDDKFPYTTDNGNCKILVAKTDEGVKFYPSNVQYPNIAVLGRFDFTRYSKVKMNILSFKHGYTGDSEGVKCFVGVIKTIPSAFGNIPTSADAKIIINKTGELEFDVSNIKSEAYLFVKVVANDSNNIGHIEFEDLWIE